ncbi:MAG: peptidylprolyl isomerase [Oscillatoria sp. PMC 1068.18]|nr:peptidylprolyl isomerase [Oscillatoria sp. PMC 1076.18]MEC4991120.1 peptidylprolyl isomerase [Oscillatoria sp. PMC 1068.18]
MQILHQLWSRLFYPARTNNVTLASLRSLLLAIAFGGLMLGGCSLQSTNSDSSLTTQTDLPVATQVSNQTMKNLPKLEGKATVEMTVNGSPITIEVDGDQAPVTAGNFVDLVDRGFYNGLTFHRVVTSPQPFVAQGGDPQGTGTGGFVDPETSQPRYVPLEIQLEGEEEPTYGKALGRQAGFSAPPVALKHTRGAIAMARSQMPDSASSQFYFALSDLAFLDGDYAVFGYVTDGMDVVDSINQGDSIDSAKVVSGIENLRK